jgi:dTDP-4-dehydrorhamnose 3,5-epimerase
MRRLSVTGAWAFELQPHPDERGVFVEWFQSPVFRSAVGPLSVAQANCSVSRRGVLRGIHFTDTPPGQAKYVTCVSGRVLDVVVDLRVGSPTFGLWDAVELTQSPWSAVYLPDGTGHAFMALTERATVVYLCTELYGSARERALDPFDPDLAIAWPGEIAPILSPRDQVAPSLRQALADGSLPTYDASVRAAQLKAG